MLESDAEYISSQLFNLSQAESIVELYTKEQAVHFVLREAGYATNLAVGGSEVVM